MLGRRGVRDKRKIQVDSPTLLKQGELHTEIFDSFDGYIVVVWIKLEAYVMTFLFNTGYGCSSTPNKGV